MTKDDQQQKQFLTDQLEWCKEQDRILAEIERKLHEMKRIAAYALEHMLTSAEVDALNLHLNELKRDVASLEQKLHSTVH